MLLCDHGRACGQGGWLLLFWWLFWRRCLALHLIPLNGGLVLRLLLPRLVRARMLLLLLRLRPGRHMLHCLCAWTPRRFSLDGSNYSLGHGYERTFQGRADGYCGVAPCLALTLVPRGGRSCLPVLLLELAGLGPLATPAAPVSALRVAVLLLPIAIIGRWRLHLRRSLL